MNNLHSNLIRKQWAPFCNLLGTIL